MSSTVKHETLWYVDNGRECYLPYPGPGRIGSKEVAQRIVDANPGWEVVQMAVRPQNIEHEESE